MSEDRSNLPAKVTLEELLRFKRCERPAPEFWAEFERTLRQRQLAALVVRKSWWRSLAMINKRLSLPLGAAALLGLAYFTVYQHAGHSAVASTKLDQAPARHVGVLTVRKSAVAVAEAATPVAAVTPSHVPDALQSRQPAAAKYESLVAEAAPEVSARAVKPAVWLGEILANQIKPAQLVPSSRSITADYAARAVVEPEWVDSWSRPLGFESRAVAKVHPAHTAEILPTAVAVTESRRARMLVSLNSSGSYVAERLAPDRAQRSVLRSLSQESWDHSMRRLEAEGDKLSIRF